MAASTSVLRLMTALLLAGAALPGAASARHRPELAWTLREGRNLNLFLRDGPAAAHLVARGGNDPRLIVAFPAGNSGIGLWFAPVHAPLHWQASGQPLAITTRDARGRLLHGICAHLLVRTDRLTVRQALLSNIRMIRDVEYHHAPPATLLTSPVEAPGRLDWARDRLDGAPGYRLRLKVERGSLVAGVLHADAHGMIALALEATTGDTPLPPLTAKNLLKPTIHASTSARSMLAFLSYREKFLAGSWRFDTYFGRDTLLSLRLLMPALRSNAIEAGLRSVLARVSPEGEVAHEEGLSEYALIAHAAQGRPDDAAPVFDYGMVDTSLLLPVVLGDYLADHKARAFLAQRIASQNPATPDGRAGDLLMRNLRLIWGQSTAFAQDPVARHLLPIKPGRMTGQWRDSEEGLARGRYAYDVNAVLMPAALRAMARLCATGVLAPYRNLSQDAELCSGAAARAALWQARAPALFALHLTQADARQRIATYAAAIGIDRQAAIASVGRNGLTFHALALDGDGTPIPVLHSDEGFALLFSRPSPEDISRILASVMRPFPAGLMTPAGMVIANPAFADAEVAARFGAGAYHGTVVWSWQQALMAAGLDRQLARRDLPWRQRQQLIAARQKLWRLIDRTRSFATSELWSWRYVAGPDGRRHFVPVAYGAQSGDGDEANAAQLWSTVYLGLRHPHMPGARTGPHAAGSKPAGRSQTCISAISSISPTTRAHRTCSSSGSSSNLVGFRSIWHPRWWQETRGDHSRNAQPARPGNTQNPPSAAKPRADRHPCSRHQGDRSNCTGTGNP